MKHHVGNAEISVQSQLRKRCVKQSIRPDKYVKSTNRIIYCQIPDPQSHCIEDITIDIEEINEAADDEEENREMEIVGFLACPPDSVRPRISLGKQCTHPRSFG